MSNINKNFGEVKGNFITMNVLDEVPSKDLTCNTIENVKNKGEEMEEDDPIYIENEVSTFSSLFPPYCGVEL